MAVTNATARVLTLDGERTTVTEAPGPPGAPTVVLLHGLGATTSLNFPGVFEALGGRFRVVGLDLRGHGNGLRARQPFTLDEAGADVVSIADALDIDRMVLVGYSKGVRSRCTPSAGAPTAWPGSSRVRRRRGSTWATSIARSSVRSCAASVRCPYGLDGASSG